MFSMFSISFFVLQVFCMIFRCSAGAFQVFSMFSPYALHSTFLLMFSSCSADVLCFFSCCCPGVPHFVALFSTYFLLVVLQTFSRYSSRVLLQVLPGLLQMFPGVLCIFIGVLRVSSMILPCFLQLFPNVQQVFSRCSPGVLH